MTEARDSDRLFHMLEAARKAVAFSHGKSLREIQEDEILSLALLRLVEVFGEAARCISIASQRRHPDIPWTDIIGTRTWMAHGYMNIDMHIVYNIIARDFPLLIPELERMIEIETEDIGWNGG